jgi:hypothetical protein
MVGKAWLTCHARGGSVGNVLAPALCAPGPFFCLLLASAGATLGWTKVRGLVSPTGDAALRRGAAWSVTARALSRRSGMLGWRVRASRPAPDWCLASLALGISFRPGGEGAVFG